MSPRKADKHRRLQFRRVFARSLRANATDAERKLWSLLRCKQLGAYRFRRQQPIGPYIADFFCPAVKLIVELDGEQHGNDAARIYDDARDSFLKARGYRVLRFSNADLLRDPACVVESISRVLQT